MSDDWSGLPKIRKYPSFHAGEPALIIKTACAAVGLTTRELESLLLSRFDTELNLADPSTSAWFAICEVLHLDVGCISYGYFPDFHRKKVGRALYEGKYILPTTPKIRRIWKWYRGFQKRERSFESNHYGKRLLFRVRREQFVQDIKMAVRRWGHNRESVFANEAPGGESDQWFFPGLVTSSRRGQEELGQEL